MLAAGTLPVSLLAVAQVLRGCFTAPSFEVFTHLLAGMVTTRGPRTVTGMLTGAGLSRTWSHHRVHRFFSRAAWDPRKVGLALAGAVIEALVPAGADVRVAVDDTLLRRRGKIKVWAALWTHDGSARSQDQIGYGNTWVIAAIPIDRPFASRPVALPVLARLWRGKDTASRSELALAMVRDLKRVAGQRIVHVVADAAYHHPQVAALPAGITWTTRLGAKSALHDLPPARTGKRGRPRKKGDPLGSLVQIAAGMTWRAVTVQRYGQPANVRLAERRVQWYGPWKDPAGPADPAARQQQVLRPRAHHDRPDHPRRGHRQPVRRPLEHRGRLLPNAPDPRRRPSPQPHRPRRRTHRPVRPDRLHPRHPLVRPARQPTHDVAVHRALSPWYARKTEVSFQDMTDTLRRVIIAARFTPTSPRQATNEEILAVTTAWAQAA